MSAKSSRRIAPSIIAADIAAHDALHAIVSYSPANPAYAITELDRKRQAVEAARTAEAQAAAAYDAARDGLVAAEWEYHNAILGSRVQVMAQFGKDSNEVQSVGLKKVSEYKKPTRRKAGGGGGTTTG
ncbi:MAG TPA: hypothetical protein VJ842_01560 [Pyrinomonadaceae bacterium]|nr:hypothetical protein [Pyrinomonadaceae bacterium]